MASHLEHPPIREVACGFIFDPIVELDPMLIGTYWGQQRDRFPGRQLLPAISEGVFLPFPGGTPPFRSWLVTKDEAFVLQIQHDRLYFNWRRRSWDPSVNDYPRFSDHQGKGQGILTRTVEEFEKFREFCISATGKEPTVRKLELSKIDCLVEGQHWSGLSDLSRMLPWTKPFAGFAESSTPHLGLRVVENRSSGGQLIVAIASAQVVIENKVRQVVNLETRLSTSSVSSIKDDFLRLNDELNRVFVSIIPEDELNARFGSGLHPSAG